MGQEIESKFRLSDPRPVRERLGQLGAERVEAVSETNLILDTPARELLGRGCGLRVRVAEPLRRTRPGGPQPAGGRRVTLTYKGPRDADLHTRGIRAREEIETDVADDQGLLAVLSRLGFAPVVRYEKRRETWRLPDAATMPATAAAGADQGTTGAESPSRGPRGRGSEEFEIVLDELPQLGWFVEIEAPTAERLERVCQLLNLDPASATRETYPELAARHGQLDSDGARSLQF